MKAIAKIDSTKNKKVGIFNQSKIIFFLCCLFFSAISYRLFWLQVIKGRLYRQLSAENRIRLVSSPPIRGRLLDRNGKILADNKLTYSLSIQPRLITKDAWPSLLERLSEIIQVGKLKLDSEYQKGINKEPYRITLVNSLTSRQVLRFKEQESTLHGAQIDINLRRNYPYKTLAAHVLGYTQPITATEYPLLSSKGYLLRDRIGRTGVEAAYEKTLRGKWGGEMLEVDAAGSVQRSLGIRPPKAGEDLVLTIDLKLQLAAEKALSAKNAGAIVVLDPRDGSIRAMASRPTFDPNFFSQPFMPQKQYDRLFLSRRMPLFSRAINAYDPGSTWKLVTAMAGMESGKFPSDIRLKTTSCLQYGGHCFPEHNGRGFGMIGYEDALRVSSNTFFYQVGVGVGDQALYNAAVKLGFNALTGIELGYEESKGLVGNKDWADKGRDWGEPGETPWIPEDIASASIGQSVVQITPLQLARAYAVFANGGYLVTPHLAENGREWDAEPLRKKVNIQPSTLETIRKGLLKVVNSGTGSRLTFGSIDLPPIAGKTGTAEDSTGGSDHAWFVCFAPYYLSELVIVAFAENTPGGGSTHAVPMARQVLEVWHQEQRQPQ